MFLSSNHNSFLYVIFFLQVRISRPVRDLILKLSEVGWLYSEVHKFCQSQQNRGSMSKSASVGHISGLNGRAKLSQSISHSAISQLGGTSTLAPPLSMAAGLGHSAGPTLVNQALVLALKDHLNEHCRLIAVLEAQVTISTRE